LDTLPVDFLIRPISTTTSRAAMGEPSASIAISGRVVMVEACTRSMPLCTSVPDPFRKITAFVGKPVDTRVCRSPSASIKVAAKTNTTSAMPPAVKAVVIRRVSRLR